MKKFRKLIGKAVALATLMSSVPLPVYAVDTNISLKDVNLNSDLTDYWNGKYPPSSPYNVNDLNSYDFDPYNVNYMGVGPFSGFVESNFKIRNEGERLILETPDNETPTVYFTSKTYFKFNPNMCDASESEILAGGFRKIQLSFKTGIDFDLRNAVMIGDGSLVSPYNTKLDIIRVGDLFAWMNLTEIRGAKVFRAQYSNGRSRVDEFFNASDLGIVKNDLSESAHSFSVPAILKINKEKLKETFNDIKFISKGDGSYIIKDFEYQIGTGNFNECVLSINNDIKLSLPANVSGKVPLTLRYKPDEAHVYTDESAKIFIDTQPPILTSLSCQYISSEDENAKEYYINKDRKVSISFKDDSRVTRVRVFDKNNKEVQNETTSSNTFVFTLPYSDEKSGKVDNSDYNIFAIDSHNNENTNEPYHLSDLNEDLFGYNSSVYVDNINMQVIPQDISSNKVLNKNSKLILKYEKDFVVTGIDATYYVNGVGAKRGLAVLNENKTPTAVILGDVINKHKEDLKKVEDELKNNATEEGKLDNHKIDVDLKISRKNGRPFVFHDAYIMDIKEPVLKLKFINANNDITSKAIKAVDKAIFKGDVDVSVIADDLNDIKEITAIIERNGIKEKPLKYNNVKEAKVKLTGKAGDHIKCIFTAEDVGGNITEMSLGSLYGDTRYDNIVFAPVEPKISTYLDSNTTAEHSGESTYLKNGNMVTLEVRDDVLDLVDLQVSVNDVDQLVSIDPNNPKKFITKLSLESNKINKIVVIVKSEGYSTQKTISNYKIDTLPPNKLKGVFENLNNAYCIGNHKVFKDGINFTLTAEDNDGGSGIKDVKLLINNVVQPTGFDYSLFESIHRIDPTDLLSGQIKKQYSLKELPESAKSIVITLTDKCDNAKNFYFNEIENFGAIENIHIDRNAPIITVDTNVTGKADGDWYDDDKIFYVKAVDDVALRSIKAFVNGKEIIEFTKNNASTFTSVLENGFSTKWVKEHLGLDEFNVDFIVEDLVGRKNKQTITVKIDRYNPVINGFRFDVSGKVVKKDKNGKEIALYPGKEVYEDYNFNETDYAFFFKGGARVIVEAEDQGSGLDKLYYTFKDSNGKIVKKDSVPFQGNNVVIALPENFKGFISVFAVDKVGHQCDFKAPDGFVNSDVKLNSSIIDIDLPKTEFKDKSGLDLYPSDVQGKIIVKPNEFGWKNVIWGTNINGEYNEHGNIEIKGRNERVAITGNQKGDVSLVDRNLVIDLTTMLSVTNNNNNIKVWVKVIDNRDDDAEREVIFSIDKDKPIINVTYDQTNKDNIYAKTRYATVTIEERNFDFKDVKIDGNNTGVSSWQDLDANTHQCTVEFAKDNDYQLKVNYTDLAGNKAKGYESEVFTIDKTAPVIQVSYDQNTPQNGNFFNKTRTATIKITEHNFDASRINIAGNGVVGKWHDEGDIHMITLLFANDGEYDFTVSGADRAGNLLQTYQSEHFIIDLTDPTIIVDGVENGVSHKGDVTVRVSVSDTNLDAERTSVTLESRKNGVIEMQKNMGDTTGSFVLPSIPTEREWDDAYLLSIVVTDKAGNRRASEVTFTVNRFGSVYDIQQNDIMGKATSQLPSEFVFKETSVDKIDMGKTTIDVTRAGMKYDYDPTLLQKEEKKIDAGYEYTYILKSTAFVDDGKYILSVVSVAEDGTKNGSAQNDFMFLYDRTNPIVSVSGIERDMTYLEESRTIAIDFDDLSGLAETHVSVNGKKIDPVKTDMFLKFNLPQQRDSYTVEIVARDQAGNETKETISGVRITTDPFELLKAYFLKYGAYLFIVAPFLVLGLMFLRTNLKRKRRVREMYEENIDA